MVTFIHSREAIEPQLDQIELLRAMYPGENELVIDESTQNTLSTLRLWCEDSNSLQSVVPSGISFTIILEVGDDRTRNISVSLELSLTAEDTASTDPQLKMRVRQPDWLTKAEAVELAQGIPEDDVLSALELVRENANIFLSTASQSAAVQTSSSTGPLVRVWFYFPSISTREKRNDIVNYAPSYSLTGFLLAGKPGILCLEGTAQDVDDYMKFIKTESWGDIPSQHKKVSERLRESRASMTRVFSGMEEITDQLEKRGERGNRGDMKMLELWLSERGLGDAFSKVLM